MKVLIAPDSFGDTLTAVQAAEAIAEGWLAARHDEVVLAPQSDGGPGFVEVLAATGGTRQHVTVAGPLGDPVTATWLQRGDTAFIESAQACGLALLPHGPTPATARGASTFGVGELVTAALAAGVHRIVVGLGGSCSNDGGRGLVAALGGVEVATDVLAAVEIVIASDVTNPLLGPRGAIAVFGAQKGASGQIAAELEAANEAWAAELGAVTGREVSATPGAGAAGGLGFALLALGATMRSGADIVGEITDRAAAVAAADLVITGEGKFDSQTLGGKVAAALAAAAAAHSTPIIVFAGQVALDEAEIRAAGIVGAFAIVDIADSVEHSMTAAGPLLTAVAEQVAGSYHT